MTTSRKLYAVPEVPTAALKADQLSGMHMDFDAWLIAHNWKPDSLRPAQRAALRNAYQQDVTR
ncbi:hypothetical protein [Schlesneria sp. T3-172]|uniref:hypothetical protein n=1 Tax=Schlesneria sphaerica TaxID=3373610 RepID=UPI0037C9E5F2